MIENLSSGKAVSDQVINDVTFNTMLSPEELKKMLQ